MNVRLISTTAGIGQQFEGRSPEEILIHIARVSSRRDDKFEDIPRLIGYLIRNRHWSPFEMASMCVEITTSRAISLQIVRHRSFSYQQFSQRYAASSQMEPVELRMQAEKNRQSSTEVTDPFLPGSAFNDTASSLIERHLHRSVDLYESLLRNGVSKETARFILPATTQTTLYMHGTLRSWIHYLEIRDDDHVQKEHRDIAREIKRIFTEQFPMTSKALGWL